MRTDSCGSVASSGPGCHHTAGGAAPLELPPPPQSGLPRLVVGNVRMGAVVSPASSFLTASPPQETTPTR
jgi:hypothetical protein